MKKIVCFGEIMLRLSPPGYSRFIQANSFDAVYGGGEANVSVSLANYGLPSSYVTKLPEHPIGQAAVNALRAHGVDTSDVVRGGDRVGIYYLEKGADMRPSKVVYDRAYSAVAMAGSGEFDWARILDGAGWLHFSGITPAISPELAKASLEAAKAAKGMGITVSCDLNYRSKMWTYEQAKPVMLGLMPHVDVLIANEEHIKSILDVDVSAYPVEDTNLSREGLSAMAQNLFGRFGFSSVAITQRRSITSDENKIKAALFTRQETAYSRQYTVRITDRVGSGDAFSSGIIYGLSTGLPAGETVEFAVMACCLKHSVEGDFGELSAEEIKAQISGGSLGVQR